MAVFDIGFSVVSASGRKWGFPGAKRKPPVFFDDFESGSLSKWSFISPGAFSLTQSPSLGGYALGVQNGILGTNQYADSSVIVKHIEKGKYTTFSAVFNIVVRDDDDPSYISLRELDVGTVLTFVPARQYSASPSRKFLLNNSLYLTLDVGSWYKVVASSFDFLQKKFTFTIMKDEAEVFSETVSFEDTGCSGIDTILIGNQGSGGSDAGFCVWDNVTLEA
jgi:hypothetical protein